MFAIQILKPAIINDLLIQDSLRPRPIENDTSEDQRCAACYKY